MAHANDLPVGCTVHCFSKSGLVGISYISSIIRNDDSVNKLFTDIQLQRQRSAEDKRRSALHLITCMSFSFCSINCHALIIIAASRIETETLNVTNVDQRNEISNI